MLDPLQALRARALAPPAEEEGGELMADLSNIRRILEEKLEKADPLASVHIAEAILKVEKENGVHGDYEALAKRLELNERRLQAIETHLGARRPAGGGEETYNRARMLGARRSG
jgi:hypothetical protein